MVFYSAKELRTSSRNIWDDLSASGEAIITNNGKPTAIMISVADHDPEILLKAMRQAKAMITFNAMREKASESGLLSAEEIEAEIAEYRAERKAR